MAAVLSGAWRPNPSPLLLPEHALEEIIPILIRQGSAGMAWARMKNTPLGGLSRAENIRNAYRFHTLRARLLERQLGEVLIFLNDHGIRPIVAKGWALGRLYAEPGLRPYGDLDLLVPRHQLRDAEAALARPGAPLAPVELHSGFPMLRDRSSEQLFRRSRPAELAGIPLRLLGAEDELRLVCLHGLNHGLCRPLWLCDVAVLLESLTEDFDWSQASAGESWLSEGVRCALGLARELLGTSLEAAGVPQDWRTPSLPDWLVPAALGAFGASAHYMDLPDPSELLRDPRALLGAARLRWANPLEATYRREAPWSRGSRFRIQLSDYLFRGFRFLERLPNAWDSERP